jgi:hypothetical protein
MLVRTTNMHPACFESFIGFGCVSDATSPHVERPRARSQDLPHNGRFSDRLAEEEGEVDLRPVGNDRQRVPDLEPSDAGFDARFRVAEHDRVSAG